MTNREKYAEQILDIACDGGFIAVDKNTMNPRRCKIFDCEQCYFNDDNGECNYIGECKKWCNAEYIEPPIDWSKVPVDTLILVRDNENDKWTHRYFAKYENGQVYAWGGGATSWSAENNYANTTDWCHAKLAENED